MRVIDIHGTPHLVQRGESLNFDVFAKQSGDRYLVLASNDGELFDPTRSDVSIKHRDKKRGSMFWKLRICSKECYNEYVVFLRNKNRTPYLLAQRRFLNES